MNVSTSILKAGAPDKAQENAQFNKLLPEDHRTDGVDEEVEEVGLTGDEVEGFHVHLCEMVDRGLPKLALLVIQRRRLREKEIREKETHLVMMNVIRLNIQ